MKIFPDFTYEKELWDQQHTVIGIDEVGRGAFAGPVGVGGVVFRPNLTSDELDSLLSLGINDSKKLTAKKRQELSLKIKKLAYAYHIALIPVEVINEIGVGKATFLGMAEVAKKLSSKVTNPYLLIDAFEIPGFTNQKGIIRGDCLSISIAAASIIAKVERDMLMDKLGASFPKYGFAKHKGYGTLFHRQALQEFGSCMHHRNDFVRHYV